MEKGRLLGTHCCLPQCTEKKKPWSLMPALIEWMDPIGEPQIGNHGRLEIKQQLQSANSGTLQTGGRRRRSQNCVLMLSGVDRLK